jgi:hypothetical protein
MQHMVQIDILGPFYLHDSSERNYFISCLDDCSRKVDSKWSKRKREAYNKIVKNEFLAVEDTSSIDGGKLRYDMFIKAYNETREHGGINTIRNGLTPSEMFLQTFNISHNRIPMFAHKKLLEHNQ